MRLVDRVQNHKNKLNKENNDDTFADKYSLAEGD